MKKNALLAACIAVITIIFSCSKEKIHDQKIAPERLIENSSSKFGGGDDDKPIIMHRVVSPIYGPLQYATVRMTKATDTLQATTDVAGECTLELPSVGTWGLRIQLGGYSAFDTSMVVTDSFSLRITNLRYQ